MTAPLGGTPDDGTPATEVPARLLEFFQDEARDYTTRLAQGFATLPSQNRSAFKDLLATARALRGAAAMARLTSLSASAGQIERILKALHLGLLAWSPELGDALGAALAELPPLVEAATHWDSDAEAGARRHAIALEQYAAPHDPYYADQVVPIATLFYDGPAQHIRYVVVTPQTQFEQQLRDLATSTTAAERGRAGAGRTPTAPRGHELQELLQVSVSRLTASFGTVGEDEVSIDALLYTGAAALHRAGKLVTGLRAGGAPTPEVVAELADLIRLAETR